MSLSQRLKLALSMNCLNSSVSSRITAVITRSNALSCSIRAFWRSEFWRALRNAVSAATRGPAASAPEQVAPVDRHAGVQDRIEPVAILPVEVAPLQLVDLLLGIDLGAIQVRLQVVQLVGVGLVGQNRGSVVVRERLADGVGVVEKVEHGHVVLLAVRPVECRPMLVPQIEWTIWSMYRTLRQM